MSWFQDFGFEADPYRPQPPFEIPPERIKWNRDDMKDQLKTLNNFLEDLEGGYKTGLLVYGAIGSGKTWLARLIEKEYLGKVPSGLVLRTKVNRFQPDFSAVYEQVIRSLLDQPRAIEFLQEKVGKEQSKWPDFFGNEDLGNALYHIAAKDVQKEVAKNWLLGYSVPAGDIRGAGISLRIGSSSYMYEILRLLIEKCVSLFPATVLIVDELENATPAFARQLSDVLRELLDSFVERFTLCCLFTFQSLSEWYDYGYNETLLSRINYRISLDPIKQDSAANWLRQHHEVYRSKTFTGKDQLSPFAETGVKQLLSMMNPEKAYPRYILTNCGHLVREAREDTNTKIDAAFVKANKRRLEDLEKPPA